jgi:para-nitrobenzyl esterase
VLAHLVSLGSRGLFERAIVQSGAFALKPQTLAKAEADGKAFADSVGCTDQTEACLRGKPADVLSKQPFLIPGVVDGTVLRESVGTALAAGRFARVPILNGTVRDEERIFVTFDRAVSGGTNVSAGGLTAATYPTVIAKVLGVTDARAAAIAAEYPLGAYESPEAGLSALVGDPNFACTALQLDRWTSARVPTFAYEFNDGDAPQRFIAGGLVPRWRRTGPSCSTCSTCRARRSPGRSIATRRRSRPRCARRGRASRTPAIPRRGPRSAAEATRRCCRS